MFLAVAVSPGTWPGGCWVPGGLRPVFWLFLLLLLIHDPDIAFLIVRRYVLLVLHAKGFAPIRESCTVFHFSSTDDGLTGPGYIDQLACEQKKNLFSSPIPLVPPFLIANEPWLSGFEVGHAHPSKVVHNGLCHPDGCKEVQITNPHLDWTGFPCLLRFILQTQRTNPMTGRV